MKRTPPHDGYFLTKWDQKNQKLATAIAYGKRESEDKIANNDGNIYTLDELKDECIGYREYENTHQTIDKQQRLRTYTSYYGIVVYETEQYNATAKDWYIVGNSTGFKDEAVQRAELHNAKIGVNSPIVILT